MAQAKTITFGKQYLLVGDGATPSENFDPLCGTTSWTLDINIEGNTTNSPDCDDPDLPAWLEYDEVSKQMVFTSNGVLDTDSMQQLRDWVMVGGGKNVRWLNTGTGANGGGYWQGVGFLSQYSESGERGQRWQDQWQVTISGKPAFTATV